MFKTASLFYVNPALGCTPEGVWLQNAQSMASGKEPPSNGDWTKCIRTQTGEAFPHPAWVVLNHQPRGGIGSFLSKLERDPHVLAYQVDEGKILAYFCTIIPPTPDGALRAFKSAEDHFKNNYDIVVDMDDWETINSHDRVKPHWERAEYCNKYSEILLPWEGELLPKSLAPDPLPH